MADLSTNYLGMKLKNPVIIGSCGLTGNLEGIKQAADSGAAAVVLKSIFEEQIIHEADAFTDQTTRDTEHAFGKGFRAATELNDYDYPEALAYLKDYATGHTLKKYLKFITDAKAVAGIPVIASINCHSTYNWHYFARKIEEAGADALELNVFILPSDTSKSAAESENIYYEIIREVKKQVNIPVSLKIGYYFSNLANSVTRLSNFGIDGLVLFNRPFHPDIDISKLEVNSNYLLSGPSEYSDTLRWIALLADQAGCPLIASTGIHSADSVIKQLLAGATAVQMVSLIYREGFEKIKGILDAIESWMDSKGFSSIDGFRGKMSRKSLSNPAEFERVQFMKLYSSIV